MQHCGPRSPAAALAAAAAALCVLWLRELARRRSAEACLREQKAVAALASLNNRKRTLSSLRAGMTLPVRPDDVVIATFPKCGTTLLQQLVHQLRTGGSWDFEEISCVVPWLESCVDLGVDPSCDQGWHPRAFKSHLSFAMLPSGMRTITVLRQPSKVLEAYYRFFCGYKFDAADISLEAFARDYFCDRGALRLHGGTLYEHLLSFWEQRHQPHLLILCYEDIVEDLPAAAAKVAAFIGVSDDASRLAAAAANSSRAAMLQHAGQFDDAPGRRAFNELCGRNAERGVGVTGKVNARAEELDLCAARALCRRRSVEERGAGDGAQGLCVVASRAAEWQMSWRFGGGVTVLGG